MLGQAQKKPRGPSVTVFVLGTSRGGSRGGLGGLSPPNGKFSPPKKIKLAPPKSNQISPPKILAPSKSGRKTLPTTPLEFTKPHRLPPRSKSGRKTLSTTPPLEFTKPHRLPPFEIGPENSINYPPRIHGRNGNSPPLNSIPRSATGPSPPKHLGLAPPNIYT